jgi:DNA-binding NarL/FixJ family response regulator
MTAKVIMVTGVDERGVWEDRMMQGAIGYIGKDAPFNESADKVMSLWKETQP